MSSTTSILASATSSAAAASSSAATASQPASYKIIGVCLAVGSGFLIGSSFVIKKKGLIQSTLKSGNLAGEGHAYLKSWVWWIGMTTMIIGELCNFAAFAFTEAILVTPLGALSVVVCAILSTIFLKETLTFFGWIGCALCILGAVILALNAPETQSVTHIAAFEKLFIAPGFLVWASLSIIASLILAFVVAPKYGKTSMFVYIGICSMIGGLSVSCLQGLGASILTSIRGENQFKNWFIYFIMVFVVVTLVTEINYLNKALELFNTSMVTPTYYILFTTSTLISSFILYQGLKSSAISLVTMVMGFLVTCLGITLLQMSKVDPKKFEHLDRRSTILLTAARNPTEDQEKNELTAMEEPGMDALRGGFGTVGSIIRARSVRRMSNASSLASHAGPSRPGFAYPWESQTSTHQMSDVPRYSLSDNPMPDDALDRISIYSGQPSPIRGRSTTDHPTTLRFDEQDKVHQYALKGHTAIHSSRPATSPSRPGFFTGTSLGAPLGQGNNAQRSNSKDSSHSIHMITESPLEENGPPENNSHHPEARRFKSFRGRSSETTPPGTTIVPGSHGFQTPYDLPYDGRTTTVGPHVEVSSSSPTHLKVDDPLRSTGSSKHGISGLISSFANSSGPDLRLHFGKRSSSKDNVHPPDGHHDDGKRGGPHRGTRDYPHLRKDQARETEERAGLVASSRSETSDESDTEMATSPTSPLPPDHMDIISSYGERDASARLGDEEEKTPTLETPPVLRRLPVVPGAGR